MSKYRKTSSFICYLSNEHRPGSTNVLIGKILMRFRIWAPTESMDLRLCDQARTEYLRT